MAMFNANEPYLAMNHVSDTLKLRFALLGHRYVKPRSSEVTWTKRQIDHISVLTLQCLCLCQLFAKNTRCGLRRAQKAVLSEFGKRFGDYR